MGLDLVGLDQALFGGNGGGGAVNTMVNYLNADKQLKANEALNNRILDENKRQYDLDMKQRVEEFNQSLELSKTATNALAKLQGAQANAFNADAQVALSADERANKEHDIKIKQEQVKQYVERLEKISGNFLQQTNAIGAYNEETGFDADKILKNPRTLFNFVEMLNNPAAAESFRKSSGIDISGRITYIHIKPEKEGDPWLYQLMDSETNEPLDVPPMMGAELVNRVLTNVNEFTGAITPFVSAGNAARAYEGIENFRNVTDFGAEELINNKVSHKQTLMNAIPHLKGDQLSALSGEPLTAHGQRMAEERQKGQNQIALKNVEDENKRKEMEYQQAVEGTEIATAVGRNVVASAARGLEAQRKQYKGYRAIPASIAKFSDPNVLYDAIQDEYNNNPEEMEDLGLPENYSSMRQSDFQKLITHVVGKYKDQVVSNSPFMTDERAQKLVERDERLRLEQALSEEPSNPPPPPTNLQPFELETGFPWVKPKPVLPTGGR